MCTVDSFLIHILNPQLLTFDQRRDGLGKEAWKSNIVTLLLMQDLTVTVSFHF